MKKIYILLAFLSATLLSAWAALPEGLVLPDIDIFLKNNPVPDSGSVVWNEDSILYVTLKEPRLKDGHINYDSVWACKNEPYDFVLYRLTKTIDVPYVTNIQHEDLNGDWPTDVTYAKENSVPVNDFPKMTAVWSVCNEMKSTNNPSAKRVRQRPFCYFNDWYNNKLYSRSSSGNKDSYPSGHAYFRALFGNCLELIDPENHEAIQTMMDQWLHCRLQKGAHWNSDLTAGKKFGEMAFDLAMECDAFRAMVFEARSELKAYRGELSDNPEASDVDISIESDLYNLLGSTKGLTINRTFYKDGYFNTLCLPFGLSSLAGTPLEGAEVFAFESATMSGDELELHLVPVIAIEAGKPYLIRWASGNNIYSMTFNDVTITAHEGQTVGTEGVRFVGTMGQTQLTANNQEQLFVGANNKLYWPEEDANLKGFRAYFLVSGSVAPHSSPARFVIRNTPTGVQNANSNEPVCKRIENGQVLIIRNGVKYNAQGQTVK